MLTLPRRAVVAVSFATLAAIACKGSQSRVDGAGAAGTSGAAGVGAGGRGGGTGGTATGGGAATGGDATGGGGATGGAVGGGTCNAANHSFAATPVAGGGACTFTLPPPDNGQGSFSVRPDDGAGIARDTSHQDGWDYTDAIQRTIQIFGPTCSAVTAGTVHTICIEFQFTSDRDAKRDFGAVDRDAILERLSRLPISTWSYKSDAPGTRHIGPMAQDFKLSFDVGASDKTIYPLDESGVAFAAIQSLNQKVDRLAAENARLKRQIAALRARR